MAGGKFKVSYDCGCGFVMTFLNVNRLLTQIDEIRIFIHNNPLRLIF